MAAKYNWEVRRISGSKLEKTLEAAFTEGWEVFSILPAGEDLNAPTTGDQYFYAVVVRRPTP